MEQVTYAVTTSHRQTPALVQQAKEIATELGCAYIDRAERPLAELFTYGSLQGVVVAGVNKLAYVDGAGEFFFHPGLAGLRINQINRGETDRMVEAMALQPGDRVLDCTLGLGTDAIVAGYVAAAAGRITGLENSPLLAYLVRLGLSTYLTTDRGLRSAMERVRVLHTGHLEYLEKLADNSYDVVYFDPMFRRPRLQSAAITPLRALADPAPIAREAIKQGVRVAKKRVVLKERQNSTEFARLGFSSFWGGKYSPVGYGVIECHG